jgi:hypothetical protein
LAWCAAAAFFVAVHPGNRAVAAFGTLALAVTVVVIGGVELTGRRDGGGREPAPLPAGGTIEGPPPT